MGDGWPPLTVRRRLALALKPEEPGHSKNLFEQGGGGLGKHHERSASNKNLHHRAPRIQGLISKKKPKSVLLGGEIVGKTFSIET